MQGACDTIQLLPSESCPHPGSTRTTFSLTFGQVYILLFMICDNVALQAQGAVSSHSRVLKLTCFTMSGSTQLFSRAVDAVKSQNREAPPSTRQERAKRLRLAPESPLLPLVQVRRTFVTIPEQMRQPTMRSSSEPPPATSAGGRRGCVIVGARR